MTSRKDLIVAVLLTFCLTATLSTIALTRSQVYDPWTDMNDDGAVDSTDLGTMGSAWGTFGDPTKMVVVDYAWHAWHESFSLAMYETKIFNVSTAGHRQITVGFNSPMYDVTVKVNFSISGLNYRYQVDTFGLAPNVYTVKTYQIQGTNMSLMFSALDSSGSVEYEYYLTA